MLRKIVGAAIITAILSSAAAAQMPLPSISLGNSEKRKLTPEEQAAQDARDKAYRAELNKIPEKKGVDPWGNLRDAGQTQASQSSKAKPQ